MLNAVRVHVCYIFGFGCQTSWEEPPALSLLELSMGSCTTALSDRGIISMMEQVYILDEL